MAKKKVEKKSEFLKEMAAVCSAESIEVHFPRDADEGVWKAFNVKSCASFSEKIEIIENVLDKCFDGEEYFPEVKQMAYWIEYVSKETDLMELYKLDGEQLYDFMNKYGDAVMDAIYCAHVSRNPYYINPVEDIEAILNERVEYIKKLNIRKHDFKPVEKLNAVLENIDDAITKIKEKAADIDISKLEAIAEKMKDMPEEYTKNIIEFEKAQIAKDNVIEFKRKPIEE